MNSDQSWSIIIFAYNEKGNVEKVVQRSIEILPSLSNTYEIVIIDDGSTDGSEDYFKKMTAENSFIRHIRIEPNEGIGPALKAGYRHAQYENVCAVPGDGQFDLGELVPYRSIPSDMIISFWRREKNYSLFRNFLTRFHYWVNRNFIQLKVRDINWIKIYKRKQLQSISIELTSSLLESEICAKLIRSGFVIQEVPSIYHERGYGSPKGANSKTIRQALEELFPLIRITRNFDPAG